MATYTEEAIEKAIAFAADKLGYTELRPQQKTVVRHFLTGKDVFVCLRQAVGSRYVTVYCLKRSITCDLAGGPLSLSATSGL